MKVYLKNGEIGYVQCVSVGGKEYNTPSFYRFCRSKDCDKCFLGEPRSFPPDIFSMKTVELFGGTQIILKEENEV